MQCLVTGGSGFLGSHVADELAKKNYKVLLFDKKRAKKLKKNQKMIKGNLENIKLIKQRVLYVGLVELLSNFMTVP